MLRKKEVYTIITPIPGFIPRQLAIDILHSHSEVITLNPLVLEHKPIKAPRDAAADEYYSTWYEITERIQYVPGMGKAGSGKINFNGCFHDMPWGLQTHIYAPLNIDMRNKYRIDGNQPGYEPPVQPEIGLAGLGAPADGLYLREDIEIRCNITLMSFVKAQSKAASKEMVSRMIKKAELLDAGVLQAMIENGRLRTINPADRSHSIKSPVPSPSNPYQQPLSPNMPYHVPRPLSAQPSVYGRPHTAGSYTPQPQGCSGTPPPGHPYSQGHAVMELAGSGPSDAPTQGNQVVMELPGDFYHPQMSPQGSRLTPHQPSPGMPPHQSPSLSQYSDRDSHASDAWRWSQQSAPQASPGSRPTSISSQPSAPGGNGSYGSPNPNPGDHKGFTSELPTHNETREEYQPEPLRPRGPSGTWKLEPAPSGPQYHQQQQQQQHHQPQKGGYSYNPRDYVNVPR